MGCDGNDDDLPKVPSIQLIEETFSKVKISRAMAQKREPALRMSKENMRSSPLDSIRQDTP